MDDSPDGPGEPGARPATEPPGTAPSPDWAHEQVLDVRAPLEISATAAASTAARARHEFADWLAVDLGPGDLFDDLVLVLYEALANTVDHAYVGTTTGTGPFELTARRSRAAIHITVADQGAWREAPTTATARGRGLQLIRSLVHDVHLELRPTGTTMHLRTMLPPPLVARS